MGPNKGGPDDCRKLPVDLRPIGLASLGLWAEPPRFDSYFLDKFSIRGNTNEFNDAEKTKLGNITYKSGKVAAGSFAGNPKTVTVTFGAAFADPNYSPIPICETQNGTAYTPVIENITASGFDINMAVNNINDLLNVYWTATKHGEI